MSFIISAGLPLSNEKIKCYERSPVFFDTRMVWKEFDDCMTLDCTGIAAHAIGSQVESDEARVPENFCCQQQDCGCGEDLSCINCVMIY